MNQAAEELRRERIKEIRDQFDKRRRCDLCLRYRMCAFGPALHHLIADAQNAFAEVGARPSIMVHLSNEFMVALANFCPVWAGVDNSRDLERIEKELGYK